MAEDISGAVVETSDGTIITIEVTTGAKADVFPASYNSWRKSLGCQIRSLPVGGKANIAIIDLVAVTLDVPKTTVSIRSGSTSTQKKIFIFGTGSAKVLSKLREQMP